jgi:hypothetical protein
VITQTVMTLSEIEDLIEARILDQVPDVEVKPFTSLDPNEYKHLGPGGIVLLVYGGEDDGDPRGGSGGSHIRTLEWGVLVGNRSLRSAQDKAHRGLYDQLEAVRNALRGYVLRSPVAGLPMKLYPVRNGFLTRTTQGVFFYSQVIRGKDVYTTRTVTPTEP